jgi:hypothetical protein
MSSVQRRSTISSWVRTEYAGKALLHMRTIRASVPTRLASRRPALTMVPTIL